MLTSLPTQTQPTPPAVETPTPEPGHLLNAEDFALADLSPQEIWNRIITTSVRGQASDVHMTFQDDQFSVAVRADGQLCPQGALPAELGQRLVGHIKVAAGMDPSEKRRPQDGHIACEIDGRPIDLRIAILSTNHGESVAVRIQDRETSLLELDQLSLSKCQTEALSTLIEAPSGLVLVTGPTGAGKTTTLYAILRHLADGSRKVVSIENPIEYDLPGIDQCEVHYKIGLDYAALIRAVLRHDPNIVMIGEVRDAETADAVVRAANSGCLVFATTHAVDSASAVESLIALGAHPHFVARSFRGAIAQTLVRKLCRYCTVPLAETADSGLLDEVRDLLSPHEQPVLSMGRGCPHCRYTGYHGRVGVFEIMLANQRIRELITRGAPASEISQVAQGGRMISITEAGKLAALRGLTTVEELVRNISELWAPTD